MDELLKLFKETEYEFAKGHVGDPYIQIYFNGSGSLCDPDGLSLFEFGTIEELTHYLRSVKLNNFTS